MIEAWDFETALAQTLRELYPGETVTVNMHPNDDDLADVMSQAEFRRMVESGFSDNVNWKDGF